MRRGIIEFLRRFWRQPDTRALILLVLYLATLAGALNAWSQGDYDIIWITTDNGGGISAGDPFTLAGTIGQPEAGHLSGGTFVLTGGFWGGVLAGSPPLLSVEYEGGSIIISWSPMAPGLVLETTEKLGPAANWAAVATDGQYSVTITPSSQTQFYRLVRR